MRKLLVLPLLTVLILTLMPFIPATPVTVKASPEELVINVTDPVGDDKGPGYYGYPTEAVFVPGVFDIVGFEVYNYTDVLQFRVYVKELGGNPWNAYNGFCLQYVHIYIQAVLTTGNVPARTDTFGLNVMFSKEWAWHYALLIAPCWESPPVPAPLGQCTVIYTPFGAYVQDGLINVTADNVTNVIIVNVSKTVFFAANFSKITDWRFVVMLTSYDGFGPMRVRPVSVDAGPWVIWGTANATEEQKIKVAKAITLGIEPRVMDIAIYAPEFPEGISAELQYAWLDSYNPDARLMAIIPPTVVIPTVTSTVTETVTTTTPTTITKTETKTSYATVTSTTTAITTTTATKTATTTKIETTTATTTIPTINIPVTAGIAIALLLVGIGIGYAVKRR